jgi:predicted N-acetyltransferase YhbS
VAVASDARGLGIGRQLAQACIERSHELGAVAVCLPTASFIEAAVVMYERLEFQRLPAFERVANALFTADGSEAPITELGYWLDLKSGVARRSATGSLLRSSSCELVDD